jgi:hypothetical protein
MAAKLDKDSINKLIELFVVLAEIEKFISEEDGLNG